MSRRPEPPPLKTDDVRTVVVGTAVWVLAGLILLPFYGALDRAGRLWWLWACAAGAGLGLIGVYYCRRRARAIARDAAHEATYAP